MDNVGQELSSRNEPQDIGDDLVALLPKLKAQAVYLTRSADKADDLVQRACLRALSRSDQFEPGTRLDRWVARIMTNIWFHELRQRRQRQEQELEDPETVADDRFEARIEAQIMVSELRRACWQVDVEEFDLLVKIHCHDYRYQEVAAELGVPIGTVLSRVSRAKAKIKSAMAERRKHDRR